MRRTREAREYRGGQGRTREVREVRGRKREREGWGVRSGRSRDHQGTPKFEFRVEFNLSLSSGAAWVSLRVPM